MMRAWSSSPPTLLEWAWTGRTCARVIHAQMPGTVEAYYQEAGRAGRDGLPATCLLLHSPGDVAIHEFFNRQSVESVPADKQDEWERHRHDQLDLMRRYAYGVGCRQQAIMDYFGDAETLPKGCGRCDNCQTPDAAPVDGKTQETVRILLSGAARLDGRFGGSQLADLVTGSDTAQIRRYHHDQLPTYGRLSSMSKRQVQAMIQALIRQGYLRQEGLRYPVLAITAEGREVMHNRAVGAAGFMAAGRREEVPSRAAGGPRPGSRRSHGGTCRAARGAARLAIPQSPRDGGSALHAFLGPHARRTLCRGARPRAEELLTIWGFGEQKRRTFGAEILEVIASCPA